MTEWRLAWSTNAESAAITTSVESMLEALKNSTALLELELHTRPHTTGAAKLKERIDANRAVLAQANEAGL